MSINFRFNTVFAVALVDDVFNTLFNETLPVPYDDRCVWELDECAEQ